MKIQSMKTILNDLSYPGRGIVIGLNPSGTCAMTAYFIMGRSANSRNRVFVTEGEGIRTEAFDPSKMEDPSLIIYAPVRKLGDKLIVTNGDQTDTIYDGMKDGKTFEQSLQVREFEPDGPNYTPRISGLLDFEGSYSYSMSILKSANKNPDSCQRFTFDYAAPVKGEGHFIHTYQANEEPLPSFEGEPRLVEIPETAKEFSDLLWANLNDENKVSLFVRSVNLTTGEVDTIITNKNE